MRAYLSTAETSEAMRATEIRIGPAVDACMAQKDLFITRDSNQSCVSSRIRMGHFRPRLPAAAK